MDDSGDESQSPPTTTRVDEGRRQHLSLIFPLAFLYAAVPTINLLTIRYFNPRFDVYSNPFVSVPLTFGRALLFVLIFYQIGKRLNFQKDYVRLALLTYAGVLAFHSLGLLSLIGQIDVGGFSLLEQQAVEYFVSALASFGILFGALSFAFLRVQLPYLDAPPVELMTYRRPYIIGGVSFLTNFASPVLSGFIAALLFQRGLFVQDQFYFLRYYFSGTDPLYVNYIVYPVVFVLLVYYFGMKTDFNHMIVRILLYLFLGGVVGSLTGTPLGMYLRIFFNPPSPSSPIHLPVFGALVPTSVYQAIGVTLLGLSMLTIALLRRRSDLAADEGEKDQGDAEDERGGVPEERRGF